MIAISVLFSDPSLDSAEPIGVRPVVVSYEEPEEEDPGIWYYDEARAARYDAFSALRPELDIEDVVWMVEADLDIPDYTDVNAVPNPEALTALVNKHFNLPENYVPDDLVNIGNSMLRQDAADAMREMIEDAAAEGHTLWVQSGFRSFSTQAGLFADYSARDGVAVAETYSARPGHSEHQTGLAVDFNSITDSFGGTTEGIWAAENAWRYGYILRYTAENTSITLYKSEPWHFRYVGRGIAAEMRSGGYSTYEEYWVKYIKHSPLNLG